MGSNQYFPPYAEPQSENIRVELDLTNYATKSDLSSIIHVDTSSFSLKSNLSHYELKNKYDNEFGDLKLKVPNISRLLQTSVFNSDINEIEGKITTAEGKIPDISNLATKTEVTTKVTAVKNKIPNIINLVTKTELKNVEDKITDVNGFVKKTDYATEISEIKNDYVTNAVLTSRLNDLKNTHIVDEVQKVDDKVKKNSSDIFAYESRLKQKEDLTNELEREISCLKGKGYFDNDGLENFLVFKPVFSSFKRTGANICTWKSTGVYNDDSVVLTANFSSSGAAPRLKNEHGKLNVAFSRIFLKQTKVAYNHGTVINIYIVYKLQKRTVSNPDFTVQNALFGAAKITKDPNTSHYKYSGFSICFDGNSSFSFGNRISANNVIIFGCDMSFSSHANNKANNIYVLGKDFVQGFQGATIYAEKMYKTDFTQQNKKFVLSLHYNGDASYLFVNGVQQLKFKGKNSEAARNLLCLGNVSVDFSTTNSTKTSMVTTIHGNVYYFSVDYWPISTPSIYDIHRYLMKKMILYRMFRLIKKSTDTCVNIGCKFICFNRLNKMRVIKKSRMQSKRSNNRQQIYGFSIQYQSKQMQWEL